MRITLLLVAVAVLLAVPSAALADGGSKSSTGVTNRHSAKKAKEWKKVHVELKRSRTGATGVVATRKRELEGVVTSVSPLIVASSRHGITASLTCEVPTGVSLAGLQVGERVEVTCVLVGDRWLLRKLEQKEGAQAESRSSTKGPTASCDDDRDDDSSTLDDHDDDCGQLDDEEHDDGEHDD